MVTACDARPSVDEDRLFAVGIDAERFIAASIALELNVRPIAGEGDFHLIGAVACV